MLWDRLSLACQKCKHFICLELCSCAELTRPLRHMKAELCKGMTVLIILDLGTEISFFFFFFFAQHKNYSNLQTCDITKIDYVL